MQPFLHCNNWMEGAAELLIKQCLPANFQLSWKSLQALMKRRGSADVSQLGRKYAGSNFQFHSCN